MNVSKKDVDFAMQADRRKNTVSLDEIYKADANNLGYEEVIPGENYKEKAELEDARLIIELVIVRLPKEYRKLVELYYYQDLSQKEIAEKTNLSQMQVSRKLKKAFEMLHGMIYDSQLGTSLMGIL